jgi:hypothetical protein
MADLIQLVLIFFLLCRTVSELAGQIEKGSVRESDYAAKVAEILRTFVLDQEEASE